MVDDITERNQTDEALRDVNQFNIEIISQAGEGIIVYDQDLRYVVWNRFMERMTGAKAKDVIGRNALDIFPHLHEQSVDQLLKRALNGETVTSSDTPFHSPFTNQNGWMVGTYAPHRNALGEIIGVIATVRDITERKRAEEALREREERFKAQYQNSPVPTFTWQKQGADFVLVDFNEAAKAITDGKVREFVGRKASDLYADRPEILPDLLRCHEEGEVIKREIKSQNFVPGALVVASFASVPPDLVLMHLEDITDRKQAELTIFRSLARQKQLNQLQQTLLGPGKLEEKLKIITDGVVEIFGADFCRIWVTGPGDLCEVGCVHAAVTEGPHACRNRDRCLRLVASSGRYTHTDGEFHRRVPFSYYKIGRLASGEVQRVLINNVQNDPLIHNHKWAREIGLVSFAGYQLRPPGGDILGVLGLFSKQNITTEEDAQLDSLSNSIASVILVARAEEELEKSEKSYGDLFENASLAIFQVSMDGREILAVNSEFASMFGYSSPEDVYANVKDSAAMYADPQRRAEVLRLKAERPDLTVFENLYRRKDGSTFWGRLNVRQCTRPDRSAPIFEGFIEDFTERKQAEKALKESEQLFSSLVQQSAIATFVIDHEHKVLNWNKACEELTGVRAEEVIGTSNHWQAFYAKHRPCLADVIIDNKTAIMDELYKIHAKAKLISRGLHAEGWYPDLGGKNRFILFDAAPINDTNGKLVAVIETLQDITERKQTEEAIQESEKRFHLAEQVAHIGTFDLNVQTGANVWSPELEAMYGLPPGGFAGTQQAWEELVHSDDRARALALMQRAFESNAPIESDWRVIWPDGSTHWLHGRFQLFRDESGEPLRLTGVNIDITKRKQAEEALQNSENKLAAIIEFLPDATFVIDQEGKVVAWNRAMEEMTGVGKDDMIGQGDHAYAVPFYGKRRQQLLDLLDKDDQEMASKYQYVRRKGNTLYAETFTPALYGGKGAYVWAMGGPILDDQGNRVGAIESIRDITELKLAEDELNRIHSSIRIAMDLAKLVRWEYDVETDMFSFDDQFYSLYGTTAEQEGGLMMSSQEYSRRFIPPKEALLVAEEISKALAATDQNYTSQVEHRIIRADGIERTIAVRFGIIKDDKGRTIRTYGANQDITERKQAEEALRASKDYLDKIINSIGDPIFVIDRQHRHVLVNDALCALTNRTREEFIGKTPYDFYPREQVNVFLQKDEVVFETGKENVNEETITDFQGVTHTIVTKKTLYTDGSGNKSIVGIIRDITDRKRAEDALRESEQRLADIIDFLPDATFAVDREGKVIAWNRAIEAMTGMAKEDILGRGGYAYSIPFYGEPRPILIDLIFKDQKEIESKYINLIRRGDQLIGETFTPMLNQGEDAYLWGIASPLYDRTGSIAGAIESIRDITNQKNTELELLRSREMLEQRVKERTEELARKNTEMERFVYTVSHDLRTPLISMSGFLGLLKQDAEKTDMKRVDEDFRIISGAITKMDKLLQDTLELSRIGRIVNLPENVPFGEIIIEALEQSSAKLSSKNIKVTVDEDLPIVQVDRMRLVEVLVNLLENSMKYMGDQPQPDIEIGKRLDGENTVFFVRDNGIGIDPSQHDKVFELFYKVNQKSDGGGAGLAIVKKIIEVHGGKIWIESELGKGCTVCFILPLA